MKKILVVDDDQDILFMLKAYLFFNGYVVKTSTSCDEGIQIFYNFKPDIVLLDINVGTDDGRLMCRAIKQQSAYLHITVILMSANNVWMESFRDYGADSAIVKPFNFTYLLSLLKTLDTDISSG